MKLPAPYIHFVQWGGVECGIDYKRGIFVIHTTFDRTKVTCPKCKALIKESIYGKNTKEVY